VSTLPFSSNLQLLPESAKGIVDRLITHRQPGRVKYRGTYWFAQLYQPDTSPNGAGHHSSVESLRERQTVIQTGESVRIVAIRGITLLVVPEASY
jgi:membrane protein implicated in regulation of membrane protease activity